MVNTNICTRPVSLYSAWGFSPHSPILRVDGQDAVLCKDVSYTFKSEYGEEDIRSSLEEMFPPFVAQLDSRVRLGKLAAVHQCIVSLRIPSGQKEMLKCQLGMMSFVKSRR